MKKQSFIYGMLMATSFLACENELPFRDKPQGPQLLMNAFLEAGKEKNEVFLHIVDGNGTTSFLEGAIIVYVNDEKTEETDVKGGSYMSKYTVQSRFCPGDRIRLETALEGGKYQGSAEVRIPQPIEEAIRVDTLRTQLKVGVSMQDCMRYRIAIHDRQGEKNYYRLVIEKRIRRITPEGEMFTEVQGLDVINQEDIVLTDGHLTTSDDDEFGVLDMTVRNVRNVFTDSRFPDGSYTLNVYTYYPDFQGWGSDRKNHIQVDVVVRLLSITEAQFRYLRAMNCLDSEDYNETFMEPVIVPQNVSGGLGFVGASSEQRVTLRMVDRPPLW